MTATHSPALVTRGWRPLRRNAEASTAMSWNNFAAMCCTRWPARTPLVAQGDRRQSEKLLATLDADGQVLRRKTLDGLLLRLVRSYFPNRTLHRFPFCASGRKSTVQVCRLNRRQSRLCAQTARSTPGSGAPQPEQMGRATVQTQQPIAQQSNRSTVNSISIASGQKHAGLNSKPFTARTSPEPCTGFLFARVAESPLFRSVY